MSSDPNRPLSEWNNWQMFRQLILVPIGLGLMMAGALIPPA